MTYQFIDLTITDEIAEITLDQPKKRNPLSFEMIAELTNVFKMMMYDSEAVGIVLAGNGPAFCSGHDFNDMVDQDLSTMRRLMHSCSELMQLIHAVPQPVVAKVHGPAYGAGCQLALTCDMVVAGRTLFFVRPVGWAAGFVSPRWSP